MVNVTNRTNVYVRLRPLELTLSHVLFSSYSSIRESDYFLLITASATFLGASGSA